MVFSHFCLLMSLNKEQAEKWRALVKSSSARVFENAKPNIDANNEALCELAACRAFKTALKINSLSEEGDFSFSTGDVKFSQGQPSASKAKIADELLCAAEKNASPWLLDTNFLFEAIG
jgi:hypothetical protein